MDQSLFAKYGGQETVNKLVDNYFAKVVANDHINGFFAGKDIDKVKTHHKAFVAFALGGPNNYEGRDMRPLHTGMGIEDSHYDSILDNISSALDEGGVSEDDIKTVIAKLEGLRNDILNK